MLHAPPRRSTDFSRRAVLCPQGTQAPTSLMSRGIRNTLYLATGDRRRRRWWACRLSPRDFPPHRVKTVRVEPKRVSRRSKWPRRAQMNRRSISLVIRRTWGIMFLKHSISHITAFSLAFAAGRVTASSSHDPFIGRQPHNSVFLQKPRPLLTLLELLLPVYKHPTPTFKWLFFHARRPDKPAII